MKSAGTLHNPNNDEVVAQVFCVLNVSEKIGLKEATGRFRIIEGEDKFRSLWFNELQSEFYLELDNGYHGSVLVDRPGELISFKSSGAFEKS